MANGVKLITLKSKPEGWTGKSWACQNGADAAKGELLLFLDADVRLGPDGMIKKVGVGVKEVISLYKESFSKPSFVLDEKLLKVSLPLPLFETDSLPTNEQLIVTLLQKKTQLTRAHFETLTGFHTSKVLRILNSLIEKSIVTLEGKGPSSTYSLR